MRDLKNAGKATGTIDVELNYRIIELFSAGLYSSPNKAFEELVTNSYDADASIVAVGIPDDINKDDYLWVADNGGSMDSAGLKELWQIGQSTKRDNEKDKKREQIGRFGIGKLATYILARRLTYICKKNNKYLAVTMDYTELDGKSNTTKTVKLQERTLTQSQAETIINEYAIVSGKNLVPFKMFGKGAKDTWTFCIMGALRSKAHEIHKGRLRWILRTALPLNPKFNLYFNGAKLESSKIDNKIDCEWIIGDNDKTVKNNDIYEAVKHKNRAAVNLPNLKNVYGDITLYEDSLASGKSEDMSRSYGIFLMVRERLINLYEPLLPGMGPFAHGFFNKTRLVVHADGLDDYITSTRESIKESPALNDLRVYLTKKLNEVHNYWLRKNAEEAHKTDVPYKVSHAAHGLIRVPLYLVAKNFFNGSIKNLKLIEVPEGLDQQQQTELLSQLEADIESPEGIIRSFDEEYSSPSLPMCRFDLASRKININMLHPFVIYCIDAAQDISPLKMIATTEVLMEAQMVEIGIDEEKRVSLIKKRDNTLRSIASSGDKINAATVAEKISNSESDPDGLEEAVVLAFKMLGFDAAKIGGSGKPDGLAIAHLGADGPTGSSSYRVTLDAKSTSHTKAQSSNIDILTIDGHREKYAASYAVVVAPDFQGSNDPSSKICQNVKKFSKTVTLLTTTDLIKLVLFSGPSRISLKELRGFFESCATPEESANWIEKIRERPIEQLPYKEILDVVWALQKEDPIERPTISAIRISSKELKKYSAADLREFIEILCRQVPSFVELENETIILNQNPEIILKELRAIISNISPEFQDAHKKAFSIYENP